MLPAKRTIFRAATRAAIHAKCGGRCAYCGVEIEMGKMAIDHIHPRACGGSNDHSNLNPSCRACNNFKAIWSLEEFRRHLSQQVDRCRKYSVNFRNAERFGMVQVVGTEVKFYFERLKVTVLGAADLSGTASVRVVEEVRRDCLESSELSLKPRVVHEHPFPRRSLPVPLVPASRST